MMKDPNHSFSDSCVDNAGTFPTFKTDATTRTDWLSRFTLSPEFSFSFRTLHDFILADFLKMPSVSGPFWLIKESISCRKKRKVYGVSYPQTHSTSLPPFWTSGGMWWYTVLEREGRKSIWIFFFFSASLYIFYPKIHFTVIQWNILNTYFNQIFLSIEFTLLNQTFLLQGFCGIAVCFLLSHSFLIIPLRRCSSAKYGSLFRKYSFPICLFFFKWLYTPFLFLLFPSLF